MIKMIGMMKRKPGISPQEFARYWKEEHAPLGFEVLPDDIPIRGYIQNCTHRSEGDPEPEFDGVVEVWFDDMETFQRWFTWYLGDGAKPPSVEEVQEALERIKGVALVKEEPSDDKAHTFAVAADGDVDVRPEIFQLMVDKGWLLIELHRDAQTLGDVFRDLTRAESRTARGLRSGDDEDEYEDDEEEDDEEYEDDDEEEDDEDDDEEDKKS